MKDRLFLSSRICKSIYRLLGWNWVQSSPLPRKCIVVFAPHTAKRDFLYIVVGAISNKEFIYSLIKKSLFWWPLSFILKRLGGIPIDNSLGNNSLIQISRILRENDICIGISPEGKLAKTEGWRLGFYYLAARLRIPIALCYINYKKKNAGIIKVMTLSNNIENDFAIFRYYYRGFMPRYPERRSAIKAIKRTR